MSVSGLPAPSSISSLNVLNSGSAVTKPKAAAAPTTGSTTGSTSGSGLASSTTGTTFLNLLVKELQNQDPTAPMDSTAMVGQMISLNQLDQLVSINSDLTPTTTAAVKAKTQAASSSNILANSVNGSQGMSSNALMSAQSALMNNASTSSSVNAASLAASDPSTTLDLTNINSQFGGK